MVEQEVGAAFIVRNFDTSERTVEHAGPRIRVAVELLDSPDLEPDVIEPDGTLRLDTAGEYRYRCLGDEDQRMRIYERIGASRPGS